MVYGKGGIFLVWGSYEECWSYSFYTTRSDKDSTVGKKSISLSDITTLVLKNEKLNSSKYQLLPPSTSSDLAFCLIFSNIVKKKRNFSVFSSQGRRLLGILEDFQATCKTNVLNSVNIFYCDRIMQYLTYEQQGSVWIWN